MAGQRTAAFVLAALMVPAAGLARDRAQAASAAPTLAGTWSGTLTTPAAALRLSLTVTAAADGGLVGVLDSVDQGQKLPVSALTSQNGVVRFQVPSVGGSFEGTLSPDGSQVQGTWTQGGGSLPLLFTRGALPPPRKRPQEPSKPYPYIEEQISYVNRPAGVTLAGTLTRPREAGKAPAVLLISGSGAEDRDETVFGHKPFLVLADYLTRNGIAVLRVDDRGVGGSSGQTSTSTSEDFAGDVLAGVAYLKTRSEIDSARIGLIGHSEGGLIAPIVASQSKDVAFLVLLAGPALPGEEILHLQAAAIMKAMGASDAQIEANRQVQERMLGIVKAQSDPTTALAALRNWRDQFVAALPAPQQQPAKAQLDAQIAQITTPWFRFFLTYDPRPALTKVRVPVLALDGELDLQVPAEANLHAIEAALHTGGNQQVTIVRLPSLNHLFQTARTGTPAEYPQIEETMAPSVLKLIADWIAKH
jgi:pimeloyl-ACP methyl ester carboxylesterase